MQLPDHDYLFGRVISVDAKAGWSMPGSILIYIYSARSARKNVVPTLHRSELLVPPMMTNRLPWTKGFFEFIKNEPLAPEDRLPQHSFKDVRGWYFDEQCNRLPGPVSPVGQWGLHSYRTIDDEISRALGIPLAPNDAPKA